MRLRTTLSAVAVATLATTLGTVPAQASGSRTLTGPATGDPDVFLTYVGCGDVFTQGAAPQSRINLGPYSAPLGRRSLGLVPAGAGSASGPYTTFDSLAGLDASLSVASTSGTTGVSYVVTVTPSSPAGTAWVGRADLTARPGSWSQVSPSSLTYDWQLVDLSSRAAVSPAGSATPAQFAADKGDGQGFAVTGFGCDGRSFNLDAVRVGSSTLDFEGVALSTAAAVDGPQSVAAGKDVTLTGRVTDASGRVTGDSLVLESRAPGGAWKQVGQAVLPDRDGVARVVVPVTETTEYRWHRPESQYADEGWSAPVTITVTAPETTAPEAEKADGKDASTGAGKAGDKTGSKGDDQPGAKAGANAEGQDVVPAQQ
jgi:hypothetical protein